MGLEQVEIREIVNRAVNNKLDIPEFQREFVWDAQKVRFLIESLYRGYPVGSFLFWDAEDYTQTKGAHGGASPTWIVDGQQRTTALCILMGMKPYWWPESHDWNATLKRVDVMVNLLPDDRDGVEFALPNPVRRKDPRWAFVRPILGREEVEDVGPLAREFVAGLDLGHEDAVELFTTAHGRMTRLWQTTRQTIPVITVDHEPEDVAEIFARLNQAGTRVREADVVLALAAVKNPGWVRDEYLPFAESVEDMGWALDAGIYIRTITGIGIGRARLKEVPAEFWNPESLIDGGVWKRTKQAISDSIKRLAGFGLQSDDLVPSNNALIPLFVFQDRWADHPTFSFDRLYRWFLLANRDGRYSGSAVTSLNEDVRDLTQAHDPDDALLKLTDRLRVEPRTEAEEFRHRYDRAGSRFLRLMVYLTAYDAAAVDWVDGTRIGYDKTGSPATLGYKPHWHHIWPKKTLTEAGFDADRINALANITVLNEDTNVRRLKAKPPRVYITEFEIAPDRLRRHMIPPDFAHYPDAKTWSIDAYDQFLGLRAQLLADATNRYLDRLEGSSAAAGADGAEPPTSSS